MNPGFRITQGKGFDVAFPNGWTLSVQWGPFNYCENRDYNTGFDSLNVAAIGERGCANAEIAVIAPNGEFINLGSDTVAGWVTPTQVAAIMNILATEVSEGKIRLDVVSITYKL